MAAIHFLNYSDKIFALFSTITRPNFKRKCVVGKTLGKYTRFISIKDIIGEKWRKAGGFRSMHWLLTTALLSLLIFLNTIPFLLLTRCNHSLLHGKISHILFFNQWPAYWEIFMADRFILVERYFSSSTISATRTRFSSPFRHMTDNE